jgi:hypothetical protein
MKRLCFIIAASLAAVSLAPSAQALSCMRPDIERELKEAKESETVYHIFVGYFDAPQIQRKEINGDDPFIMSGRSQTVEGFFSGVSLAKRRRDDVALERLPVRIETSCAAHWCGRVPPRDRKMIVFVKAQTDGSPLMTVGPCPHMAHNYSDDKVKLLRRGL